MNLKLPGDVHLAVGDDGSLMLLVGGFVAKLKADELADVMRGKALKNGPRKARSSKPAAKAELPFAEKRAKHAKAMNKKGLCTWCGEKAKPGKKLCGSHLLVLSKNRAKKKSSNKAAA